MLSMPDTAKALPKSADSHLIGCLLLHQYRQDQVLGITWYSKRVRSLLWYYLYLTHKEQTTLLQAAYLNGVIQEGARQIKRLVKEAEGADLEGKYNIVKIVLEIQTTIEAAKNQFNQLEYIPLQEIL